MTILQLASCSTNRIALAYGENGVPNAVQNDETEMKWIDCVFIFSAAAVACKWNIFQLTDDGWTTANNSNENEYNILIEFVYIIHRLLFVFGSGLESKNNWSTL